MTPEQARELIDLPAPDSAGKPPLVAVAMSGGVDSCVVSSLAAYAGFEVIGLTLQLYDAPGRPAGGKTCCAGVDIRDAKQVARKYRFRHYTLNYQDRFRQHVVTPFVDSYLNGQTPVPCVLCNQKIKFLDLLDQARAVGATALLTGHYVRRQCDASGKVRLFAGTDQTRDQSYFLFATTAQQAAFLRFPLGNLSKSETRALADFFELPVSNKPASQDICFVPRGDYRQIVKALRPEAMRKGSIIDRSGQILGQHEGIANYTVGQRRKLPIASTGPASQPYYVTGIDQAAHTVTVGRKHELQVGQLVLSDINLLDSVAANEDIQVKYRSNMTPVRACFDHRAAVVTFAAPQAAVAPGQACVFYRGHQLLGGGWISRTVSRSQDRLRQQIGQTA